MSAMPNPVDTLLDRLGAHGVAVGGLAVDSRRVQPGDIFLAYPGAQADGRDFIGQAVARGAAAVVAEAGDADLHLKVSVGETAPPLLEAHDVALLAGELAHRVYGRPSERLWLAGVTGTNGKTSVTQWIAESLGRTGTRCGVIGTLGNGFLPDLQPALNTTPDAVSLHATLAGLLDRGAGACAMEVSSIGLHQGRVNGAHFAVAVLTNLSRDHLDYHGDMDDYAAAKAALFERDGLPVAVLNLDDAFGRELAARLTGRVPTVGYTLEGRRDADRVLAAMDLRSDARGMTFMLDGTAVAAPLVGRFNAANLLAVAGALLTRGLSLREIAEVAQFLEPPPGRMETLGGSDEPLVVVDYAHTPDALEKALSALRDTATARGGRLWCVFGCGGERDPGKRPQMGAVAEAHADAVVVTSDNPRSEDAQAIIAAILAGMRGRPEVDAERGRAIEDCLTHCAAADVVLIAGKGHEPYQEIAGVRYPFSDVAVAKSALARRRP